MTYDCGLIACTTGSAPGPTLDNEYGKPMYIFNLWSRDRFLTVTGYCEDDKLRLINADVQTIIRQLARRRMRLLRLNRIVLQWSLHLQPSVPRRRVRRRQRRRRRLRDALCPSSMSSSTHRSSLHTIANLTSPFSRSALRC